jgi:hypothetical protein
MKEKTMTVQEVINTLEKIEDKNIHVMLFDFHNNKPSIINNIQNFTDEKGVTTCDINFDGGL